MAGRTRTPISSGAVADDVVTIKKYANRRLYNTATSSYVTLDHLCQMVKDGIDFAVFDAKTGDDITRNVLTQIIVEEENKGENLLPISFLRQLISFYGNNMQAMLPGFLDVSIKAFADNQEQLRRTVQSSLQSGMDQAARAGMMPLNALEELTKRNLAMFEQTMRLFSPPGSSPAAPPGTAASAEALKSWIEMLQQQLTSMTGTSGKSGK